MVKIGDYAKVTRKVEEKDIDLFAQASGDFNPLHTDDDYASRSIFKRRIAHGMLSASYISAVLGTILPGEGSIYVSQSLKFLRPVFIGNIITTSVTVTDIKNHKAYLDTICKNEKGEIVTQGEAVILLPNEGVKHVL